MITELVVTGGKNFEIVKLKADLEKDTFDFTISIPELDIAGRYDIDATIAGIPLKGKGPLILKASKNPWFKLFFETALRNFKTVTYYILYHIFFFLRNSKRRSGPPR